MNLAELKNEKIAVLGLSTEGISSGEFLNSHHIPFTVLEKKDLNELGAKITYLKKWNVEYILGASHLKQLSDYTLILRSPGIPLFLPPLKSACQQGIVISSNTKLFMELCPSPVIGVTGTKGKGTTTILISKILEEAGHKVFIGGNMGKPPLDFLDSLDKDSKVVLELSSFQLEDFTRSPWMAVVLGLAPDHLAPESSDAPNFHASEAEYFKIKEKIVAYQTAGDFAILNYDDDRVRNFGDKTQAKTYYFSRQNEVNGAYIRNEKEIILNLNNAHHVIGDVKDILLPGKHNWWNLCAAVTVGGILDCPPEVIGKAIFAFKGYEHRLELINESGGIKFYDDSAATNPEPCMAAIRSFEKPMILIAGGTDKGQDYGELGKVIAQSRIKLLYLIGDMAGKIKDAVDKAGGFGGEVVLAGYPTMEKTVAACVHKACAGDIIILSPACASFDMYLNYKDRGNQFKQAVEEIIRNK